MSTPDARMLAAVLVEPGRVELSEVRVPEPGAGEVLVRVEAALTCGTDIKTYRRGHPKIPLPTPMGHEFAGTVAAVGAGVDRVREGDAVACVPTAPCGECRLCRRGQDSLCPEAVGRMVFGAFAEYALLPRHIVETNLFARPAGLPAAHAAALEPLSCVVHGADRIALERAETVVLVGDGPIALLFLQLAKLADGPRVLLAGKHPVRLDAARTLGADDVVDVTTASLDAAVRERTDGVGADAVVEVVGRPQVWERAASLVAPGGELLVYGGCAAGTTATFDTYRIHYDEVDVKGAFHYGRSDVRRAWDLLTSGAVRVAPLITAERRLAELEDALEMVLGREAVKVAVRP